MTSLPILDESAVQSVIYLLVESSGEKPSPDAQSLSAFWRRWSRHHIHHADQAHGLGMEDRYERAKAYLYEQLAKDNETLLTTVSLLYQIRYDESGYWRYPDYPQLMQMAERQRSLERKLDKLKGHIREQAQVVSERIETERLEPTLARGLRAALSRHGLPDGAGDADPVS